MVTADSVADARRLLAPLFPPSPALDALRACGFFTLPHQLAPLALQKKQQLYGLLLRCSAQALIEMAADPKRLGAPLKHLLGTTSFGFGGTLP